MRWALNGSVAMNGREREGWEGVEGLQEGSKGLSYTDEWALASNHRVASLSNESEDATRKESTCKLIFTKRKGYRKYVLLYFLILCWISSLNIYLCVHVGLTYVLCCQASLCISQFVFIHIQLQSQHPVLTRGVEWLG